MAEAVLTAGSAHLASSLLFSRHLPLLSGKVFLSTHLLCLVTCQALGMPPADKLHAAPTSTLCSALCCGMQCIIFWAPHQQFLVKVSQRTKRDESGIVVFTPPGQPAPYMTPSYGIW